MQGNSIEEFCVNKYVKQRFIDEADVIAPVSCSVSLHPSEGTLSNRWNITYSFITEKKLAKMKTPKAKSGKRAEVRKIKEWYDEQLLMSVPFRHA